ncbi:MAG: DUF2853 family protein [Bacteroidia bacterium]
MSKFDDAMATYKKSLTEKVGVKSIDEALLTAVAKGLGPSIYNADSSKVSSSDQAELDRVKNNFLIKKLGLSDGPELDAAISEVSEQYGKSNPSKYRAVFYYLLVQKFGKQSVYS